MRYAHKIVFTLFAKPDEDIESLRAALKAFAPADEAKQKKALAEQIASAEGHFENDIHILTCTLTGEAETAAMMRRIFAALSKQDYASLLKQKENRLDDELNFFLRLDKKSMLKGEWKLTDGGDCLHARVTLAAYPKTKASALGVLDKIFKDLGPSE